MPRFRFSLTTLILLNFSAATFLMLFVHMQNERWVVAASYADDQDNLRDLIGENRIRSLKIQFKSASEKESDKRAEVARLEQERKARAQQEVEIPARQTRQPVSETPSLSGEIAVDWHGEWSIVPEGLNALDNASIATPSRYPAVSATTQIAVPELLQIWYTHLPSPYFETRFYKDNQRALESDASDCRLTVRAGITDLTELHATPGIKIEYAEHDSASDRIFSIGNHVVRIWKPTRPESWRGAWRLPESWLLATFVLLTALNFRRDRKIK